jgi:hypothetical protein
VTDLQLYNEIISLPPDLKRQVSNFIEFLNWKAKPMVDRKSRRLGAAKGLIEMSPDFDEPQEDFKYYK